MSLQVTNAEPKTVFLTGATGMIGRAMVLRLRRDGHRPIAWVRNLQRGQTLLGQEAELVDAAGGSAAMTAALQRSDAVINLAGAPIIGQRWNDARKQALIDSRVGVTKQVVAALKLCTPRPRVLVSGSAVGIYGADQGPTWLDEAAPASADFLAQLCVQWEAAALAAESLGMRVVLSRTGIVLGHDGGMLAKMLPVFEAGLGATLGNGKQFIPWIHLCDMVEALLFAVLHDEANGPFNASAPEPVTAAVFSSSLAVACNRTPPVLKIPTLLLRAAVGEAAGAAVASQRTRPQRLETWGFKFKFATLESALADLLDPSLVSISAITELSPQPVAQSPYLRERRPRYVLQASTLLPAHREDVFAFFCRAENLGLMTPTALALSINGAAPATMAAGVQIAYTLRVGPVPLRWRTEIMHWAAPSCFVDAQLEGPYRAWWHEHHFTSKNGNTTLMQDRVYYAPPLGPLGQMANVLMVTNQLRRIFWYRASAISLRYGNL